MGMGGGMHEGAKGETGTFDERPEVGDEVQQLDEVDQLKDDEDDQDEEELSPEMEQWVDEVRSCAAEHGIDISTAQTLRLHLYLTGASEEEFASPETDFFDRVIDHMGIDDLVAQEALLREIVDGLGEIHNNDHRKRLLAQRVRGTAHFLLEGLPVQFHHLAHGFDLDTEAGQRGYFEAIWAGILLASMDLHRKHDVAVDSAEDHEEDDKK
jgi:hypothetical protein